MVTQYENAVTQRAQEPAEQIQVLMHTGDRGRVTDRGCTEVGKHGDLPVQFITTNQMVAGGPPECVSEWGCSRVGARELRLLHRPTMRN
ncbi:hypothetical protein FKM82_016391 [Ascaphus truei]